MTASAILVGEFSAAYARIFRAALHPTVVDLRRPSDKVLLIYVDRCLDL